MEQWDVGENVSKQFDSLGSGSEQIMMIWYCLDEKNYGGNKSCYTQNILDSNSFFPCTLDVLCNLVCGLCVCLFLCMHVCMHVCMRTCVCACARACACMCARTCTKPPSLPRTPCYFLSKQESP